MIQASARDLGCAFLGGVILASLFALDAATGWKLVFYLTKGISGGASHVSRIADEQRKKAEQPAEPTPAEPRNAAEEEAAEEPESQELEEPTQFEERRAADVRRTNAGRPTSRNSRRR
jgi:hypothetical protein